MYVGQVEQWEAIPAVASGIMSIFGGGGSAAKRAKKTQAAIGGAQQILSGITTPEAALSKLRGFKNGTLCIPLRSTAARACMIVICKIITALGYTGPGSGCNPYNGVLEAIPSMQSWVRSNWATIEQQLTAPPSPPPDGAARPPALIGPPATTAPFPSPFLPPPPVSYYTDPITGKMIPYSAATPFTTAPGAMPSPYTPFPSYAPTPYMPTALTVTTPAPLPAPAPAVTEGIDPMWMIAGVGGLGLLALLMRR